MKSSVSAHWAKWLAPLPLMGVCLTAQAAQNCVPGTWQSPPNNLWDSVNGAFPVQAESEHFQFRWPAEKPDLLTAEQRVGALAAMEKILTWFTGAPVNWPEPDCQSSVKYKIQIFTNDGYGLSGAGGGNAGIEAPAMWVGPGALRDAATGLPDRISGMVHEFTHAMQFSSKGMRNTEFGGWMWESHAEFMAHQYPGNSDKTGCTVLSAWQPHLYFGSTRVRYCNWQFWDALKDKYGFEAINNIFVKSANVFGQDPLAVLMRNQGWTPAQLGDEFGLYAMRNVAWDYIDAQDGFDRGAAFRRSYGPNADIGTNADFSVGKRLRLARLEPIDVAQRRFMVSKYFAPQRYGYNLVRLVPDTGATQFTVKFRGVTQAAIAPGAEFGSLAQEPTSPPNWTNFPMALNPASNWRWGVVVIDQAGKPRYSALQRGASGDLTITRQPGDQDAYLAVAAAPDEFHGIFWDQKYHTLYRYPYKLEFAGAMPDGYQPGYNKQTGNQFPAGAPHPNGGGWVASGAQVGLGVFVGPNAAVLGGTVLDNASIEDYAIVWNGTVQENAVVGGMTQLINNMTVGGNASIRSVMAGGQSWSGGTIVGGTAILYGDLETHYGTTPVTKGAFTGFQVADMALKPEQGANRTSAPIEVTALYQADWPADGTPPPVNVPPTVTLTAPTANASFVQGAAITVFADAADRDGTVARVEFYDGATLIGSDATAPYSLDWTTAVVGPHSLTAKAFDNAGATTTSAAVAVTVAARPVNVPPSVTLSAPAANASFVQGTTITVSANAADSDGSVTKVEFYDGATLIGSDATAPYSLSWTGAVVGPHSLTAKAFDNAGATTTSAAVAVTVAARPANVPPTVTLSAPTTNASFVQGTAITVSANAADSDGSVTKVEFYDGATLIGSDAAAPYSLSWTGAVVGPHSLTAKAFDNAGANSTSPAIGVTVTAVAPPPVNVAPMVTLSAPVANASFVQGTAITVSANAADSDGSVTKVEFYDGAALIGSDATAPYSLSWTGAVVGPHSLTAKAFDNAGATTTSAAVTVNVTAVPVQPVNLAPTAILGTSYVSPWERLAAVNNNIDPANSADKTGGAYGNWQGTRLYGRTNWVSFSWPTAKTLSAFEVYWWNDRLGIATPTAANVQYWNGSSWVQIAPIGLALNTFNRINFNAITTTRIRVSMKSTRATGILEARVFGN